MIEEIKKKHVTKKKVKKKIILMINNLNCCCIHRMTRIGSQQIFPISKHKEIAHQKECTSNEETITYFLDDLKKLEKCWAMCEVKKRLCWNIKINNPKIMCFLLFWPTLVLTTYQIGGLLELLKAKLAAPHQCGLRALMRRQVLEVVGSSAHHSLAHTAHDVRLDGMSP